MKSIPLLLIALTAIGCSKSEPTRKDAASPSQAQEINIPDALIEKEALDPNEVLVNVNGHELTRAEALRQVDLRLGGPAPVDMPERRIEKIRTRVISQVVDQFVKMTLLLEEADRQNITIPEEDILKGIAKIKEGTPNGKEPQGILNDGPAGSNSLRNEVLTGLRVEKLLAKILPTPKAPSEEEINAFMKKHQKELSEQKELTRASITKLLIAKEKTREFSAIIRKLIANADIQHGASVIPYDRRQTVE